MSRSGSAPRHFGPDHEGLPVDELLDRHILDADLLAMNGTARQQNKGLPDCVDDVRGSPARPSWADFHPADSNGDHFNAPDIALS